MVGSGGGLSVLMTDYVENNGLRVPVLPREITEQLLEFSSEAGNILRNPIDYSQNMFEPSNVDRMIRIATASPEIDLMVAYLSAGLQSSLFDRAWPQMSQTMFRMLKSCPKPAALVIESSPLSQQLALVVPFVQQLISAGLPVFFSASSAARAINALIEDHRVRGRKGQACAVRPQAGQASCHS